MGTPTNARPRPGQEAEIGERQGADIIVCGAPQVEPLAVGAADAARMVGCSARHWYGLLARGAAPRGVRLGKRRVWLVTELCDWLAAGAPDAERWDALRAARGSGR